MKFLPFNLFGLRVDKAKEERFQPAQSQTRASWENNIINPFNMLDSYNGNMDFFDRLRQEIPILDIAPIKINRLIGDFDFEADNEAVRKELIEFKELMRVGTFQRGFQTYQYQMFDSAIAKGQAFSEIVPLASMRDIAYMKVVKANSFRFMMDDGRIVIGQMQDNNFMPVKLENQDYIQYLATDIRDGDPRGKSLFYSLPFMTQILLRMEKSIDNTVWRVGDPSFIVKVKGERAGHTGMISKIGGDFLTQIANISKERRLGRVRDAVVGLPDGINLEIDILGDGKFIEHLEYPMNQIIDEIVGKTGLPHWMLGINRTMGMNATLSDTQADMLNSDISWYRSQFDPIIERIFETHLILTGKAGQRWKHVWDPINLRDEKTEAEARKYNADAAKIELENIMAMDAMGLFSGQEEVDDLLRDSGLIKFVPNKGWYERRVAEKILGRIIKENEVEELKKK